MNKFLNLAAGFIALAVGSLAAPLSETTAVLAQPRTDAPIIGYLKAGTEPAPVLDSNPPPSGWLAVEVPGDVTGFVQDKNFTKQLEVKDGVSILAEPKADAAVLEVMHKGEKTVITGIHGRWYAVKLVKKTGYVYLGTLPSQPNPAPMPETSTTPAMASQTGVPAPAAEAPASQPVVAGTAVPIGQDAASLPRFFQGTFQTTKRAFTPRRPYDWALNDSNGTRFAYLDVTGLLLTEQIDKYVGHEVVVFGGASAVPGTKDIVIKIESLQLR